MNTPPNDFKIQEALDALGVKDINLGTSTGANSFANGPTIDSFSPVDGQKIGSVVCTSKEDYEAVMAAATTAFAEWRTMPAPQRGEIVRQFGNKLRDLKEPLGKLVSYEMGKSLQEGFGEVQEMIDICDFAVGLSRQLNGQTIPSERPGHVMREQWHPIGVVGIISAFNFPVAVWAWNTALAWPYRCAASEHVFHLWLLYITRAQDFGTFPPAMCGAFSRFRCGDEACFAELRQDMLATRHIGDKTC